MMTLKNSKVDESLNLDKVLELFPDQLKEYVNAVENFGLKSANAKLNKKQAITAVKDLSKKELQRCVLGLKRILVESAGFPFSEVEGIQNTEEKFLSDFSKHMKQMTTYMVVNSLAEKKDINSKKPMKRKTSKKKKVKKETNNG